MRKSTLGHTAPLSEFVASFLSETDDCRNMETYARLLTQGIASIQGGEAAAAETSVFDFGGLLARKFWHHAPSVLSLFDQLQSLAALKLQKERATSNATKAGFNTSIKAVIERIKTDFFPSTERDS